jgi:hypothetical protein
MTDTVDPKFLMSLARTEWQHTIVRKQPHKPMTLCLATPDQGQLSWNPGPRTKIKETMTMECV